MRKSKKDPEIGAVVSNFGFAFEVFKAIAHAVTALGGTMKDLRRIVNEPELQQQIANLVVPMGLSVEYRVYVDNIMSRDKVVLDAEFSAYGVSSPFYDGRKWNNHSSCPWVDLTRSERAMFVNHFNRVTFTEDIIIDMEERGYRPATHLELYAFSKVYPELQRQFSIVALGSFAEYANSRYVAALSSKNGERIFECMDYYDSKSSDIRFLFVRK